MSDKSPLFVSALELLAHATELYANGHPRKFKFVILHLANAIELILKDCLIDHGVSIYKNPNETVTIWGALSELSKLGIAVPEKPIIELLIDDRNTIQHRFGFPDAEAVFYYLEQVVAFFARFLREQYNLVLAETLEPHLSKEHLALLGLVEDNYKHLRKLMQISPEAAVLQAFKAIESETHDIVVTQVGETPLSILPAPIYGRFLSDIAQKGYLPDDIEEKFRFLRHVRNRAAHVSSSENKTEDWQAALEIAIQILSGISKARKDGLFNQHNKSEDGELEHLG